MVTWKKIPESQIIGNTRLTVVRPAVVVTFFVMDVLLVVA
jgi:hypothetical protein